MDSEEASETLPVALVAGKLRASDLGEPPSMP